jgi:hypothetical protein
MRHRAQVVSVQVANVRPYSSLTAFAKVSCTHMGGTAAANICCALPNAHRRTEHRLEVEKVGLEVAMLEHTQVHCRAHTHKLLYVKRLQSLPQERRGRTEEQQDNAMKTLQVQVSHPSEQGADQKAASAARQRPASVAAP